MSVALDLGAASLKRAGPEGPVPDAARGGLRTPAALARSALAAARETGERRVALVGEPDEAARRSLLQGGLEQVEIVPAPLALALAAGAPSEDRALWAVLDAGHSALRIDFVRWHRLGERSVPRVEKSVVSEASLGGAALDAALAREAWSAAALPEAAELSARGFSELKELAAHVRGPLARPVALAGATAVVAVPAHAVKSAFATFMARARSTAPELARAASGASRVIAGGGLLELAPFRAALAAAFGAALVVLDDPVHAAARGALRALEQPVAPRCEAALSLLVRKEGRISALELVPAGALLPARFGPVSVTVAAASDPLELVLLEGPEGGAQRAEPLGGDREEPLGAAPRESSRGARSASLPRRPLKSSLALSVEWSFEEGWRLLPEGGAPVPLAPAEPARAKAAREALAFDFAKHGEVAPLDALFVFVATRGEGPLLARAVETISMLARRASEKASGLRVAAIATGDHPQGGVKPRYVTLGHPWGDLAALERFAADQARDPVDGVDAPEALECALAKAGELAWRPDAEKVLYVLTDVPPHEKTEPPFCAVDWREGVKKLRGLGVTLVPVLLEGAALAPEVARRTRAFLEALRTDGEPVHAVRSRPQEGLLATIDRLAARSRPDAAAREALGRVAVAAS